MEKIQNIVVLIAAAIIVLFVIYKVAEKIAGFIIRKIVEKRSQNERISKKLDCQWTTIKEIKKEILNLQQENKKYWSVVNGVNATVLRTEKALKEANDPDNVYSCRMSKKEFDAFVAKCEEWIDRLEKDGIIDLEDIKEDLSKEEKPAHMLWEIRNKKTGVLVRQIANTEENARLWMNKYVEKNQEAGEDISLDDYEIKPVE